MHLVFSGLLLLSICLGAPNAAQAQDSNPISSTVKEYGTSPRKEVEHKLAFEAANLPSNRDLAILLTKSMKELIASGNLKFPKLVGRPYYPDVSFQPFIFEDTYLDTESFDLVRAQAAYRLRYRWLRPGLYARYQLISGIKSFYPNRCEVQFKGGYQFDLNAGIASVMETRFEFRNESEPFNVNLDAPPAPWEKNEFLQYAINGVYKNYRMKPAGEMERYLEARGLGNHGPLIPILQATTRRDRFHFNIKNPWGSGPNPEQAFIITVDRSEMTPLAKGSSSDLFELLEFEIELERNTSTELYKMIELKTADWTDLDNGLINLAKNLSQDALGALMHDQRMIVDSVKAVLLKKLKIKALPIQYKYARGVAKLYGNKL